MGKKQAKNKIENYQDKNCKKIYAAVTQLWD